MNRFNFHNLCPTHWYSLIIVNDRPRLRIEQQRPSGGTIELFDEEFATQEHLDAILIAFKAGAPPQKTL